MFWNSALKLQDIFSAISGKISGLTQRIRIRWFYQPG